MRERCPLKPLIGYSSVTKPHYLKGQFIRSERGKPGRIQRLDLLHWKCVKIVGSIGLFQIQLDVSRNMQYIAEICNWRDMVPSNRADDTAVSLQFVDSDGALQSAVNALANSVG